MKWLTTRTIFWKTWIWYLTSVLIFFLPLLEVSKMAIPRIITSTFINIVLLLRLHWLLSFPMAVATGGETFNSSLLGFLSFGFPILYLSYILRHYCLGFKFWRSFWWSLEGVSSKYLLDGLTLSLMSRRSWI